MRLRWGIIFVAGWLLLVATAGWHAKRSAIDGYSAWLKAEMPDRIQAALVNRLEQGVLLDYLASRINSDLAHLNPRGLLPLVQSCEAQVAALEDRTWVGVDGEEVALDWQINGQSHSARLLISCTLNWPGLLLSQFVLALCGALAILAVPRPLSTIRRRWIEKLTASGMSYRQAQQLTQGVDCCAPVPQRTMDFLLEFYMEHQGVESGQLLALGDYPALATLDDGQFDWFKLAMTLYQGDLAQALAVALANPELVVKPAECQVICHGVTVHLAATPFIYYLWYARRRVLGVEDGWFANPQANKPDRVAAGELITLMEQHNLGGRALNDLKEKGLRAKILDQNRSKVKDELVRVLGEELAAPYLFEVERDPAAARYRYRLALAPELIKLT